MPRQSHHHRRRLLAPFLCALLCTAGTTAMAAGPTAGASITPRLSDFEAGRSALHAGHGASAIEHLERAVAATSGIAQADSRFLLAHALMLEKRYADARSVIGAALAAAAESDNPTQLTDHLTYLLAQASEGLGDHEAAAQQYADVASAPHSAFVLDAGYSGAVMRAMTGDAKTARKAFTTFLRVWPDAPQANEARVRLAALEITRKRYHDATKLYRHIRRMAPESRAGIEARLGLEKLAAEGHGPSPALARAWQLEDLEWLVRERRFDEAISALTRLASDARTARDRDIEMEALQLLARSHRERGDNTKALELYESLGKRGIRPVGAKRLAFMHGLEGDLDQARATLLKAHYGRKGRTFYTALGDLYVQFGRYADAEEAYRNAVIGKRKKKKRKKKRSVARQMRSIPDDLARKLAWAVTRRGEQPELAIEMFDAIIKHQRRKRSWAQYWRARTLLDAGRHEDALVAFEELRAKEPLSYYGIQSYSRISEMKGQSPPQQLATLAMPPASTMAPMSEVACTGLTPVAEPLAPSTVHWPRGPYAAAFDQSPPRLPERDRQIALDTLALDYGEVSRQTTRAAELHRLGFIEHALAELRVVDADLRTVRRRSWLALRDRARSDLLDNRRDKKARGGAHIHNHGRRTKKEAKAFWSASRDGSLKQALRRAQIALGDAYGTRRAAFEMEGTLGTRPDTPERLERWRQAYPIAWPDAMERFTRRHGVPSYFLYGIMVTESTFHPGAISVSDAYGLLQVIPRTGRRVADELGLTEFSPENLLRPETAIYMGSHYMGRLLAKFAGQEPLAAAAYNAGPHRVSGWLAANPDRPMDAFIEEIPFRQARRYTRKVLQQTARYRRVYHGDAAIYVANLLDHGYKAEPNY